MNWRFYRHHLYIFAFLLLPLFLSGCTGAASERTRTGFCLDTIVSVTVYDSDKDHAENVLEDVFTLCKDYEALLSISDPGSEIYRMNHADGEAVQVSNDTYALLELSLSYAEKSNGLLDVTIQPLYELWDFQGEHASIPDEAEIQNAKEKVDYRNIKLLDDHMVKLENGAQVNLGAVAKGYIADRLKEQIKNAGISSALINLGGNIVALGCKPDGKPFEIGIATPFDESGSILTAVSAKDRSVVTSGIYQRYFTINDKIYHHIIDPKTGYPVETDLNAAVVLAPSSADADACSTICMLLGSDLAKSFIKDQENMDVILIDRENQILPTE